MQKEYTQTKEQVLEGLRTDRQGLSAQEAEKRLREHGENRLKEAEKLTLFQRFVQQLKDPMLLILLAAAAVSAVTNILSHESFTEVIIILLVVLLNAVLGVVQESKAEAAIEALQTMTAATCKVLPPDNFPYEQIPGGRNYHWRDGHKKVYFYYYRDWIIWGLTAYVLRGVVRTLKAELPKSD